MQLLYYVEQNTVAVQLYFLMKLFMSMDSFHVG